MRYLSILLLILFAACSSTSTTPMTEPTAVSSPIASDIPALRLLLYNGYLDASREFVAAEPGYACDPLAWGDIINELEGLHEADKALAELALLDACKEAGHLSGISQFSAYYPD